MRPIIGSEAIASGELTRGELRWNYTAVHPDVYVAKGEERDILSNAYGAWLWSGRRGIVACEAAAALHGVRTVPDSTPIALIAPHGRRRPGIVVRAERIAPEEVRTIAGIEVTSPARTAFDLARHLSRDAAVTLLDQLAACTHVGDAQVARLLDLYSGARGIARAPVALALMNGGTRSPEETRLRLLLHDAGLPPPRTRIVLSHGLDRAVIGMGWDDAKVGISHVTPDDATLIQATQRTDLVQRLGWVEIQVADMDAPRSVVHRAREALRRRGYFSQSFPF
jgi:transcriptional regulator with AbiEi antitoxin domain of type IV toxin-antitoxin system